MLLMLRSDDGDVIGINTDRIAYVKQTYLSRWRTYGSVIYMVVENGASERFTLLVQETVAEIEKLWNGHVEETTL